MAFTGFVDEFDGSPIQTSPNSFLNINLETGSHNSIQLEWTFQDQNTTYPFSQYIYITGNPASLLLALPNASAASQGMQTIITNTTGIDITIQSFDYSVDVFFVAAGQSVQLVLTNNSDSDGVWVGIVLGATTSTATAASLIDPSTDSNAHSNNGGLAAFTNYLKVNQRVNTYNGLAYTQASGDRGSLLVWQGGNGTYQCLSAATVGNGFIFSIHNASTTSGTVTVLPATGDTIDLDSSFLLSSGESASFISDGVSKFYSLGFGQQYTSIVTQTDISLSDTVSGILTVSLTQAQNLILNFIGSYNSPTFDDVTVVLPENYTNQYYIHNSSTTNDIIVQVGTGTTTNYSLVGKGGNRIIGFTDLSNFYNIPDFFELNQLSLENGSALAPSLTFVEDLTTGLYRVSSGVTSGALGITQNAVAIADFKEAGIYTYKQILSPSNDIYYSFVDNNQAGIKYNSTSHTVDTVVDDIDKMLVGQNQTISTQVFNVRSVDASINKTICQQDINIYSWMRAYGI